MLARRVLLLIAAWAVLLGALVMAPGRPTPLLVNLGAGDEPFARGFRGGWERDGLLGSGETQFRWTLDGARLQLPFSLRARAAVARLRLARFAATPAEITLLAGPREVARWRQPPRGWRVQEVPLGALHGPLVLHFRSQAPAAGPGEADLGLALDWVELQGVTRAWPSPRLLPGLLALLVGAPLLVGLATRRLDACLASAVAAAAVSAGAFWCDRLAGPVAVSSAGPPLLLLTALILGAAHALGRRWPEHIAPWPAAAPALALALVALVVLSHPFFHYPDVDTHARFVRALRDDGTLLLDTRGYQAQTGAWTREVAGRRIAFPYSPVFHLLATPLAGLWGEVRAVKALGVLAAALTVLLVHVLARGVGAALPAALAAQAAAALLPVTWSRLTLALYPALLGQALEALLLAHLVRRLHQLQGARTALAAGALLLLAQAAYTGSLINVGALVGVLAAVEAARGGWRQAAILTAAWALALAVVVAVLYARFLPVLWTQVLPHVGAAPSEAARATSLLSLLRLAAVRLGIFYDLVFPVLAAVGLWALRGAPARPRRVLVSALAAGLALLLLRFAAPALFRDAKEVELLALPVAVCSGAALHHLWSGGRGARVAAALLGAGALAWCALRAGAVYGARFLAVGR